MWTAGVLVAAVLVVCVPSSADARGGHHGYYGYSERYSARSSLDDWRRARAAQGQDQARGDDQDQDLGQDRRQDRYDRARYDHRRARTLDEWRRSRDSGDWQRRDDWRRARYDDRRRYREREDLALAAAAERSDLVLRRGRSGPFGATSEKLVRGCAAQAAEFENWPFDAIERAAGPDETQRNALAALREAAKQAAQRLTNDCPQDVPAAPAPRLEAVEQGIDAALKAFDTVEPKLQVFYTALNDEQKARLYRDMAAPAAANAGNTGRREAREERRERYSSRRDRWRAYGAAREAAAREDAQRRAPAPG